MKKLKVKEKQLLKRDKENERKARTKRLIERGAMFEKYLSFDGSVSNNFIELYLQKLSNDKNFLEYSDNIKFSVEKQINSSSPINNQNDEVIENEKINWPICKS